MMPSLHLRLQDLEACCGEADAGNLEPNLAALAGGADGLARLRGLGAAAVDALMLTDAPLLFPPGQLALAGLRSGVRKVPALHRTEADGSGMCGSTA